MKRSAICVSALLVVAGAAALLTSFSHAQVYERRSVAATFANGILSVTIPYELSHSGEGTLTIDVLDPDDARLTHIAPHVRASAGQGRWEQELPIPPSLSIDDLVWHRLQYRFTYANDVPGAIQGTASISRILRRPIVHVLGQQSYLSGGPAAIRLIVTEPDNETPVASGVVHIELSGPQQPSRVLYTGRLNERGTIQANFRFPSDLVGSYSLRYDVDTPLGGAQQIQTIRLEDKVSILLTTEKPMYQPGQTIHVRALALDGASHRPVDGRKLTFDVEDSRGNKVFRKITSTDAYGIASAEFALADEVNLGTYRLRALLDDAAEASPKNAEIALQVERYLLPRFKVAVEMPGPQRGYRPGDRLAGTVRAHYFFGKPLADAEVTIKVSAGSMAIPGRTDRDGAFHFDLHLPKTPAGPLTWIEAVVKDTAGHSERVSEPVTVTDFPLLITAIPESGTFIPGIENDLFILTSYPDGTPAQTDVRYDVPGYAVQTARTDRQGIAIVPVRGAGPLSVRVTANDREGNRASIPVPLEPRAGSEHVLLRANHAIYRSGDRIRLQVFSTRLRGAAYVDIVKGGQTIATHDLALANGRADLELAATPEMAGAVDFHAYLLGRDAQPAGDHRLVFVQPADELRIATSVDVPVHKPGDEARVAFRVTNSRGQGVQAALGVEVVDQAVFALAQKQPGFAKVFFYLEQEAMKPRVPIRSLALHEAISSADAVESEGRDRAARVLFSAAEIFAANNSVFEFGRDTARAKSFQYHARYERRFHDEIDRFGEFLAHTGRGGSVSCDPERMNARLREANLIDAWGNPIRIDNKVGAMRVTARSAGPDGKFYTSDDLVQFLVNPYCTTTYPQAGRTIALRFEHNSALAKGTGQIVGTVMDVGGAVIPHARIILAGPGRRIMFAADESGQFRTGGQVGQYRIEVDAPGFVRAARDFSLFEGERAVLSVVLSVGTVSETVEVTAQAAALSQVRVRTAPRPPSQPPQPAAAEAHVRSWFPESLFVVPEVVTDPHGRASVTIPIADNITTWRMSMLASNKIGALGSGTSSIKVFQDFFTELDLPVTLTQGDEVSIPVAIYNYSGSSGEARLRLQPDAWFSLPGDAAEKSIPVDSGRVAGSQFIIQANRIGKFNLTLRAELLGRVRRADIVVREIEVVPNGREQNVVFNGRLDSSVSHQVDFPSTTIPESAAILVRLYPGPLSQVIEGIESLLGMPHGCFEQTSSTTYPNVLALDYMKQTNKLNPQVKAKAESYIGLGYQRLLTFEVSGGGFSWFGNAPANKVLTAYGLMEFSDMAKVYEIDSRLIHRTQQWLAAQQQADGSWQPDGTYINDGATTHFNGHVLRTTAYIAWALAVSGYQGPGIERAKRYIETHLGTVSNADAYVLAVVANFAAHHKQDVAFTSRTTQMLLDARTEQGDKAWWKSDQTNVYATGSSATVETTGLAAQALLRGGASPEVTKKALHYLAGRKDARGAWGTTQATVMALRALLLAAGKGGADANGTVEIVVNGRGAGKIALTPENNDLLHQFVSKDIDARSANQVDVRFSGSGSVGYQVVGRYFVPWNEKSTQEGLSVDVRYDRTRLDPDQIATGTAIVRNRLGRTANMVMLELGVPPGFDLLGEDLQTYREKSAGRQSGRLEKYSMTTTHAILYFNSIAASDVVTLPFRMRAKQPIHTTTFASRVYEYYSPEVAAVASPVQLTVRRR